MEQHPEERREFQRLNLNPPIAGTIGTAPVSILEIGVLGARVQHGAPHDAKKCELHFWYRDHEIAMRCDVVRTLPSAGKYPGAGYESGLRFVAAVGQSGDLLRAMLSELVTAVLEHRGDLSMRVIGPAV